MISPEQLEKILSAAVKAPSGDNTQPWRFSVCENEITLINIPEADQSLYNHHQKAALISHGCLLENLRLAAANLGYKAEIQLAEENIENVVARITLIRQCDPEDELYEYLSTRCSNRKPYSSASLSKDEIDYLVDGVVMPPGIKLILKDGEAKDALAVAASLNEKIVLENQLLHRFLFEHVTWSKAEEETRHGFYIDTFELRGIQKIAFWLFRRWRILQLFNKIGASNLISRDNAELYKKSGAIGAIIANEQTRTAYLNAGTTLQKVWLRATKLHLGLQPLSGVTLLMQRIREGGTGLSMNHIESIQSTYQQIESIFGNRKGNILMLFRVGHAAAPSACTTRRKPIVVIEFAA